MLKEDILNIIHTHEESEIVEYKENNADPKRIGKYISALGNGAIMTHNPCSYMIWGVEDVTKKLTGTTFNPELAKASANQKNKMPLITYLEKFIDPRLALKWDAFNIENKRIVCLTINVKLVNRPISFDGKAYVRSGSSVEQLHMFPEKERTIWLSFESSKFELEAIKRDLTFEEVKELLDIDFYTQHRNNPEFNNLIENLIYDHVIEKADKKFNITNLGAYTLAKNMTEFPSLVNRTLRIIKHKGSRHLDKAIFDKDGKLGLANGFENIIKNIMYLIGYKEDYSNGVRTDIPEFPQIAVRELVANALVHQDFTISGKRSTVEIFDNKVEIYNPGAPLIEPKRFLDSEPESRNNELAELLHGLGIVESRGSGIDRVVDSLENADLPAMDITVQGVKATILTLRQWKKFDDMSASEQDQSIYWHACLKYVDDKQINNASLRKRFNLSKNNSNRISKAISHAVESKLIKPYDPEKGKKFVKYIPFWGLSSADN